MNDLKQIIAKNIIKYRKQAKLTQTELAERLNYSDKSISKWERGESLPDICVLKDIADMFGTTINNLVGENSDSNPKKPASSDPLKKIIITKKVFITICSALLCWVVATVVYFSLLVSGVNWDKLWLIFIYAIPLSAIVVIVFSSIWKNMWILLGSISVVIWTLSLSIYLTYQANGIGMIFLIGIPLEIIAALGCIMLHLKQKSKAIKQN